MKRQIVVIGANHGGTAALNTILDNCKDVTVTAVDANSNISFLGCGMALWIGKQISGPEGLFYSNKELLEEKGAVVHMETAAEKVDFNKKLVTAKKKDGTVLELPYDKLILATGSMPVHLKIPGMDLENVQYVKLYQNAREVIEKLKDSSLRRVAVVGAGYIGVELAEAFKRNGREVILLDYEKTCLSAYYDQTFTALMEKTLKNNGVELAFGQKVERLEGQKRVERVITDKGQYDVDMVVFCVGFSPNTGLGKEKLETFSNGAYLVNRRQETSVPGVYAVGDCATVYNNATEETDYIALATNAVRSGIIAAHNACGLDLESPGVQGSNAISIWGFHMMSTGLTMEKAQRLGFSAAVTDYEDWQKAEFIEGGNEKVKIRIVYDRKSRRILGAQLCSNYDISMGIHLFSLAVEEQVTIDKLKLFDVFFLPHFNKPYNYITMAALGAE